MKTDARIRYTKMVIKEKFSDCLRSKPLARITVKEICEKAEINRATFYRYYEDCYDLMEKIEQEFQEDLLHKLEENGSTGTKKMLTLIMEKMKESVGVYQSLFSDNGDRQFLERLIAQCYRFYASSVHERFESYPFWQQEYLFYFLAQGCSGILSQWLEDGMKVPVGEVADFAVQLVEHSLKEFTPSV